MATKFFIPVLGKRIRVTSLDSCGNVPAAGAEDAFIATDGFISVNLSSETEDGSEIIQKKANGSLCVNEKLSDSFKRFGVTMDFCGVNPHLLSFVSNAEPYMDGEDVIGFTVPEGPITKAFALELWTGLSGTACEQGGGEASGYLLLPFVQSGVLGDITVDGENTVTFSLAQAMTKGGNTWGVGPFDVVDSATPSPLPTALDPYDHLLLIDTDLAPPPSAVDPQPMPTDTASSMPVPTPPPVAAPKSDKVKV